MYGQDQFYKASILLKLYLIWLRKWKIHNKQKKRFFNFSRHSHVLHNKMTFSLLIITSQLKQHNIM